MFKENHSVCIIYGFFGLGAAAAIPLRQTLTQRSANIRDNKLRVVDIRNVSPYLLIICTTLYTAFKINCSIQSVYYTRWFDISFYAFAFE